MKRDFGVILALSMDLSEKKVTPEHISVTVNNIHIGEWHTSANM
jgi:hypothetical protein